MSVRDGRRDECGRDASVCGGIGETICVGGIGVGVG